MSRNQLLKNSNLTRHGLLELAEKARKSSYSPYSKTSVGAALLSEDGEVFLGANIENAALTPGICAERVALHSAVMAGKRRFTAIAVSGGSIGDAATNRFYPCGSCRQCLAEFDSGALEIILKEGDDVEILTLDSLLPYRFDKSKL